MDLSAIFFVLAVLILVGMYLYAPFIGRTRRLGSVEGHQASSLLAERDRIVNALQELDFDYKLGKIPAEDYPVQRTELLQKGADILRQLDELQPVKIARADAQSRLESAVAASEPPARLTDDDLESLIATRRKLRKEKSAGFCPRCGQPVLLVDRFCPGCGKSLS
jgi:hypothetical protein